MHLIMFKYVHSLEYNMKWQAQLMQIEKKELNGKMSKSNWNFYWIYNIKKQQPQQSCTQNSSTIISKTASLKNHNSDWIIWSSWSNDKLRYLCEVGNSWVWKCQLLKFLAWILYIIQKHVSLILPKKTFVPAKWHDIA